MLERVILHCDCNSFFASVELLQYPALRDVPVAVCGSADARHGIILAKNEAAKAFGVQTAETVWSAKKKCPQLTLLPPHHREYAKYSAIINHIYEQYTDRVEPFGIDESWLDLTHTWQLFGESPAAVADEIRCRVKRETGLTISIGVSFNKVFAKLGSDYKKPDAVTLLLRDNYKKIVWPMPVGALLYVGKAAQITLAGLNIRNIGQLAAADPQTLHVALGKLGPDISRYARGEDDAPVRKAGEEEEVKSVGNGLTFKRNLTGLADVKAGLFSLADEVATRLRCYGLFATGVQVSIKDTQLKTIQRQKQLAYPTHLARDLSTAALELVQANWDLRQPIRMLTITAINLTDGSSEQLSLEDNGREKSKKQEQLEHSLDQIRKKYGKASIQAAHVVKNDLGLRDLYIEEK